jgi:hypothetical protein
MRILIPIFFILISCLLYAGPPFITDDPEPVDFKHWEFYISSINLIGEHNSSGTLPHFEVNYGLIPEVQVHLLTPMNYEYNSSQMKFGYCNTEFGIKYRLLDETQDMPQIGTFPILEIPTVKNDVFGNGKLQAYLPLWMQKSYGKFTTYGGCGYWINPGINNKNWFYTGWEAQYDFLDALTLGGEFYYQTAQTTYIKASAGFNLGGFINFSPKFHIIFSFGDNFGSNNVITTYTGFLWTI